MNQPIRMMYFTIIVNLLIWLTMFGIVFGGDNALLKPTAAAGLVFAALSQHWAYYALRKKVRPAQPG